MMKMLKGLFSDKEKRLKLIFALGIAGIALIVISDLLPKKQTQPQKGSEVSEALDETESYRLSLEEQLKGIISQIEGAGETNVLITVSAAKEYVYAEKSDIDRRSQSEGESLKTRGEPVLSGQEPLLRTVLVPKIKGAAIVCEGANDPVIQERIMKAASAVLGLPYSCISVQPLAHEKNELSQQ